MCSVRCDELRISLSVGAVACKNCCLLRQLLLKMRLMGFIDGSHRHSSSSDVTDVQICVWRPTVCKEWSHHKVLRDAPYDNFAQKVWTDASAWMSHPDLMLFWKNKDLLYKLMLQRDPSFY